MTVIKLDAATMATLKLGDRILFTDPNGTPVFRSGLFPVTPPDREPELTDQEWEEIENDPVEYSLSEAWEKIRRGEKL